MRKNATDSPTADQRHGEIDTAIVLAAGEGERLRPLQVVSSRGASVIAVTDGRTDVKRYADDVVRVPTRVAAVLENVQLRLVAYHTALSLDRSIDGPRNLEKSVTVE